MSFQVFHALNFCWETLELRFLKSLLGLPYAGDLDLDLLEPDPDFLQIPEPPERDRFFFRNRDLDLLCDLSFPEPFSLSDSESNW